MLENLVADLFPGISGPEAIALAIAFALVFYLGGEAKVARRASRKIGETILAALAFAAGLAGLAYADRIAAMLGG